MTKSPWKNVPDMGIELGAACMPSEHASDRATAPGKKKKKRCFYVFRCFIYSLMLTWHKVHIQFIFVFWLFYVVVFCFVFLFFLWGGEGGSIFLHQTCGLALCSIYIYIVVYIYIDFFFFFWLVYPFDFFFFFYYICLNRGHMGSSLGKNLLSWKSNFLKCLI